MTDASAEPAYRTLAEELRSQIAAGAFRDGARLPTESELSTRYGLSRQTVRRAFLELVGEGAVYRIPGRGTFATEPGDPDAATSDTAGKYLRQFGSIEDLMNLSADTQMRMIESPTRRVDLNAAGRLRLDTDVVYRAVFERLHDAVPFVVTTVWWPQWVARLLHDAPDLTEGAIGDHTMIGLLEPRLQHPISQCAQSITATAADEITAEQLGCAPEWPILRVDRLYTDTIGQAVELAVSHFLPEHYTYRVTLRRSAPN